MSRDDLLALVDKGHVPPSIARVQQSRR